MFMRTNKITNIHRQDNLIGYVFLSPALLVLIGVLLIPFIFNIIISLYDWSMIRDSQIFVGLRNYKDIFSDNNMISSIRITLVFTAISVFTELILGFIFALILNSKIPGVNIFRVICLLPFMVSPVVAALSWRFMYHAEFGLLNYFLSRLGLDAQLWLGADLALISVIIVEVWQNTPFVALILLAGLQTIPIEIQEAARVDGAGFWRELKDITIPLLKPVILIALLFRTTFTMRIFTPIWVLTSGGPADSTLSLAIDIYRTAFKYLKLGKAASLSWILFVISMIMAMIYIKFVSSEGE